MEHQKIIDLLPKTPNQPTKFRIKKWFEVNDRMYNTNIQIKFKNSMLKSSLCDYSDACRLVSGTITVTALTGGGGKNKRYKK